MKKMTLAALIGLALAMPLSGCATKQPTSDNTTATQAGDNLRCANHWQYGFQTSIEACTRLIQSLKTNDELATAYYLRGWAYADDRQPQQALPDFNEALRLRPNDALVLSARGMVYREMGADSRALTDYNAAVVLKPNYAPTYLNRGLLYAGQGKAAEAIADLNKGVALDGVSYMTRCFGYGLLAMEQEAIADCTKARELGNESLSSILVDIGYAHHRSGHLQAAIDSYSEALEHDPKEQAALFGRGAAYAAIGKTDLARADIQAARQIQPDIDQLMAVDKITLPAGM